ncbi:TlpA family protein disulfide reductase [Longivirga aurantiaca]|uniref:TlpA family protein disulfide reductase n=1 Tax=Longivirga aurantiaca TaxID=1837743 RepID=A0ABW1SXN6_9ACTN
MTARGRRTRRAAGAVALAAAALLLSACSATSGSVDGSTRYVAGDGSTVLLAPGERAAAPALAGTTLDGDALDIASYRGKVVVVNLWASWCSPCRAEAGVLESTYTETKGKGVEFVGIVSGGKDSIDNARAFARKFDMSYPSMFDADNSLVLAFRGQLPPSAIPTTLVLDREGRVAARALGEVDRSRLLGMIEPVLAEAS